MPFNSLSAADRLCTCHRGKPAGPVSSTRTEAKVAVAIFSSAEAIGRPYKKFAIITAADKRSVRYSEEELKRMVTDQAAKLGADAVIINNATKRKKYISDGMGYVSYDQLQLETLAIIYTDE